MASPRATVAILSIGDMGAGVARLLVANGYRVITNIVGRSEATHARSQSIGVELTPNDTTLYNSADYILSIVPPRDAASTAARITSLPASHLKPRETPLCFLDLNAVSPVFARWNASVFAASGREIEYIDGGIIGGPPKMKEDGEWYRPSIVVSGPVKLGKSQPSGDHLAQVLNVKHLNEKIGSAAGLKMCFAGLNKGFTALAIQSFTTAHNLGVLPDLQEHLKEYSPMLGQMANRGLPAMLPKAYRWVYEMHEIASTFEADGGFGEEENVFKPIATVYDGVRYDNALRQDANDSRPRAQTAEDVAALMSEGLANRKLVEEELKRRDEELELRTEEQQLMEGERVMDL